jgi:hypothetical protein
MEVELLPAVSLLPETLSVLVAPEEMLARALNGNPHLQQFRILFITGIRSGVLRRLDRSSMELIVRRAFTSVQLRTILEENHHPFLIVEHNPLLRGYGGPCCPGHEAGLAGGDHPPVRDRVGMIPGSHG